MKFDDKDWLINQYVTQRKSVTQISEECKITRQTIIAYLDKYGIYRPIPKDIHPKRW
jgi:hypothetical protein